MLGRGLDVTAGSRYIIYLISSHVDMTSNLFKVLPYTSANIIHSNAGYFSGVNLLNYCYVWSSCYKPEQGIYAKQLTLGICFQWDICFVAKKNDYSAKITLALLASKVSNYVSKCHRKGNNLKAGLLHMILTCLQMQMLSILNMLNKTDNITHPITGILRKL